MSLPKLFALAYDSQSLQDILNSSLNLKETTLVLPSVLYNDHFSSLNVFGKIIKTRNYLSTGEVETIAYTEYSRNPYQGIIASHEVDILRSARLRDLLQLPGQSYESALAFRQKTVMKRILHQNGVKVPFFKNVESASDVIEFIRHTPFPIVIKPNLGTGSEGVDIFQNQKEVLNYLKKSSLFQENSSINMQVEEFVEGTMYHINGFILNGKVISCWPSVYPQQSICMAQGKFASSYLLQHNNPLVSRLNSYAQRVLEILPTPSSMPFHLEVFINKNDEIIFCEIASRIGGKGVRHSWMESFNISLSRLFIQSQANLIDLAGSYHFPNNPNCLTGEIWFPVKQGRLENIEQECPFPWVKEYYAFYQNGDIIHKKLKNINDCLCGVSLIIADTEEEIKKRLNEIEKWVYKTVRWSAL